ncbi:MAG: hypothetical protein KA319_02515 [Ferruginibacter sp.]|nr:hypothetical protein [Ferruginibacter sp.]
MIPSLKKSGLLPVGIHYATWQQFNETFGFNQHRQQLLIDLKKGLQLLQKYGCTEVCIDGSFVTSKPFPNDVDVCYDNTHMNWKKFITEHPEFNDSKNGSKIQKEKYQSEFYAYNAFEDYILQFFQFDRDNNPKGIVKISLTDRL